MEYSLGISMRRLTAGLILCLNPYSNGILTWLAAIENSVKALLS